MIIRRPDWEATAISGELAERLASFGIMEPPETSWTIKYYRIEEGLHLSHMMPRDAILPDSNAMM